MRHLLINFFAIFSVLVCSGCSDSYDDSSLWKDIDNLYKDLHTITDMVEEMQAQLDAMASIAESGQITNIVQNSAGGYTIYYEDESGVEHSFDAAVMDDMTSDPIIGIAEQSGVSYWTTTVNGSTTWLLDVDGEMIPVTGRTPSIGVDSDGYWTIFGIQITDSEGNPVLAEEKSASVIKYIDFADGKVIFTLGDDTKVEAEMVDGFTIIFIDTDATTLVDESDSPLTIEYEIIGNSDNAVISIEKQEGVTATLNSDEQTITVTLPADFFEGHIIVMLYNGVDNVVIRPLYFTTEIIVPTGITSAEDLIGFAVAVNNGGNLTKYIMDGEVKVMNDIDMSGVEWSDYIISGKVTPSTTSTNSAVTYSTSTNIYNRSFNGNNCKIYNIDWTFDVSDGQLSYGLFSAIGESAEIRDLTLDGKITLTGAAAQGTLVSPFVGYATGDLDNCVSNVSVSFEGTDASNTAVYIGGIAACTVNANITNSTNNGNVTCGTIANVGSGLNAGFHVGGIVGHVKTSSTLTSCVNNGALSAPSGRSGGIVGSGVSGTMTSCVNNGLIQDDVNGVFSSASAGYGYKRMGGLAGGTSSTFTIEECENAGNVFSQLGCRTGGFVGHNEATITDCKNSGTILSAYISSDHGAGWVAGYNKTSSLVTDCTLGGKVGDYTEYKDDPTQCPDATFANAVWYNSASAFDPLTNGLNDQYTEYYTWSIADQSELAEGVTFYHLDLTYFNQHIYVVELDLTNEKVVLETVMADEIVPNPNANDNSNNGYNLRERLSDVCTRRRSEGRNIVAGINTGFFNSHDGFPRSFHVEESEPLFINNPAVVSSLSNHVYGFTMFSDRSISFDKKSFEGAVRVNGTEYEYYSVNDTIVRLNGTPSYDANLYTSRFVETPHTGIDNPIGAEALFIVAKSDASLAVNCGYISGKVTNIIDGRSATVSAPYVTERDEWVLQVTGDKADALAAALSVGSSIDIMGEVSVNGNTNPIKMYNGSMYRFLNNGNWSAVSDFDLYPATIVGATEDENTMMLVCVDGRTDDNVGLDYWQLYMVASKLGLHNAIRFDGGGSTTMWTYENGVGAVANSPSDSKGERSCMNYMQVRILE
ncbi:MAG: PL29 family lyase N-terminal domain-containing protein [Rikenellaceae bacterium]